MLADTTKAVVAFGCVALYHFSLHLATYYRRSTYVGKLVVSELTVYPIKSCKGNPVVSSVITTTGLENDRLFCVVDDKNNFISARTNPAMVLIQSSVIDEEGDLRMKISAPDFELSLCVPIIKESKDVKPKIITLWGQECHAIDQGDVAADFFSQFLMKPDLRLMYVIDGGRPNIDPLAPAGDVVSFADGFGYLLTSQDSLADINHKIYQDCGSHIDMRRFRPNIVVGGVKWPYEEDTWRMIKVGDDAVFENVKMCARCRLTTVDPDLGILSENGQPLDALNRYRMLSKEIKSPFFGVNLVSRTIGAKIKVGDKVEILEWHDRLPM